ncbi:hypothetical protein PsorP6_004511 [Peronosclerospora sorghi]|uniref:Uncharacterized protein n=1 Tax=Peronosclerospora sorghi TaxID=230839 RepID=A0ACC0VM78_9STRA|nr:hypothetical protein PsorP6_004511 [Peronosclerospora sorghi]
MQKALWLPDSRIGHGSGNVQWNLAIIDGFWFVFRARMSGSLQLLIRWRDADAFGSCAIRSFMS